eukprot:Pompholyxophrys_sp_v1_NODE_27_length_3750_cov_2.904465.p2 type:complete len:305 gc:universal NODE_27_length_3750_cov_2.904465:961-1875(+)
MKRVFLTPLLILGISLNAMEPEAKPTDDLIDAAEAGNLEQVKALLKRGTDVSQTNDLGQTALYRAGQNSHLDIMKHLVDAGADVNQVDGCGRTALHIAAFRGHLAIVQLLLGHGASVESKDEDGDTALHQAAFRGHLAVVQFLLERDEDVNQTDYYGLTALHCAARKGRSVVVKLLLERGASPTQKNKDGNTALQEAGAWAFLECSELLVNHLMKIPSDAQHKRRVTAWLCLKGLRLSKDMLRLIDGLIMRDIEAENRENPEGSVAWQQINTIIFCVDGDTATAALKEALFTKFWPNHQIKVPQ